jgi:hypothetical protein
MINFGIVNNSANMNIDHNDEEGSYNIISSITSDIEKRV